MINWGPNGHDIFQRTYARPTPDGGKETWAQTVERVVRGNLALVPEKHHLENEAEELFDLIYSMGAIPAGRHLWVTGVQDRPYSRNCHRAGWGPGLHDHFTFLFGELMKGGGVGANYSSEYLTDLPPIVGSVELVITCRKTHPDIEDFQEHITSHWNALPKQGYRFTVPDTREGWVEAVRELIEWHTVPGEHALTIDVSGIRPRGSELKTFGGIASGPAPLVEALVGIHRILSEVNGHLTPLQAMEIDHALASCVVAGNIRRSARMSILKWDDPHIFDFIGCKGDTSLHWSTNISVEVDDDFIALINGDYHPFEEPRAEHARAVFDAVVKGMLTNGEPGFFNSSLASVGERGDVRCTNPCGELALEEWEACNLAHVNLAHWGTDIKGALRAFRLMTRFAVRATCATLGMDPRQEAVEGINRRIGVGFFGFQEWVLAHGYRYSDAHRARGLHAALERFRFEVGSEAAIYAMELDIPIPIKTTTIAPTGTVAKMPGVTEGIHPVYAKFFERRVRYSADDPMVADLEARGVELEDCVYSANTKVAVYHVADPIVERFPEELVESVDEIELDDLLAVQAMVQRHYATNAVSFTANVPEGLDHDTVAKTLQRWLPELKGTTLMVDASRPQSPYTRLTKEQYLAAADHGVGQAIDDCATGACPVR
jgi:ribonucleoside-triphosphate reductase (thioredoxin)